MKTIQQKIKFNVATKELFETYMDAKKHSKVIGAKVNISKKLGSKFTAYDGYISGKTLFLIPNQLIVQTWRGSDWSKKEKDSILVLSFEGNNKKSNLIMVHTNVPDKHKGHLTKGWKEHYWSKWKKYFESKLN